MALRVGGAEPSSPLVPPAAVSILEGIDFVAAGRTFFHGIRLDARALAGHRGE